jgi:hypothetical protein
VVKQDYDYTHCCDKNKKKEMGNRFVKNKPVIIFSGSVVAGKILSGQSLK